MKKTVTISLKEYEQMKERIRSLEKQITEADEALRKINDIIEGII